MKKIYSEISAGELLDKISILEIKSKKIKNEQKRAEVIKELSILETESKKLPDNEGWIKKIKKINSKLWKIEDKIRQKEKEKSFDKEFIELARSVYVTNDKRFEIKNKINLFYKSNISEQKSYEKYK